MKQKANGTNFMDSSFLLKTNKYNKMKKILFLLFVAPALLFTACDPMSDINDEIDAAQKAADKDLLFLSKRTLAPEAYTLTDEDYELSSNENVAKYHNFSSSALPKDYLPEILNQKFTGEDAQTMMVTYNFYSKVTPDVDNALELSDTDYESMGQSYHNFTDEDAAKALIAKFLDRTQYTDEAGTELTVKYTFFVKNQIRYVKINADGTTEVLSYASDAVEVTDDIYIATGNSKYKNFYKIENAQSDLASYALDNGLAPITYSCKVYLNYLDKYVVYLFNGTNWEAKQSVMAVTEPLNYALNKEDISLSTWWADPAIKITLTAADYDSNDLTSRYDNFDLRSGKTPGTNRAKLVEMIGAMLDANHGAVENQQYLVTYAYYDGSNGIATIRVIKENGTWKEVEM